MANQKSPIYEVVWSPSKNCFLYLDRSNPQGWMGVYPWVPIELPVCPNCLVPNGAKEGDSLDDDGAKGGES